jgi:hypothetical protein
MITIDCASILFLVAPLSFRRDIVKHRLPTFSPQGRLKMRTPLLYQGEAYLQVAGAEVIGAILSAFLLGIIFDMTLYYLRVFFTRDRIILRLIVLLSFICITLQVGGIAAAQWDSFVANDVSKIESGALPVGLKIAICVVPIPVLLAQILFAERCYWSVKALSSIAVDLMAG